jgi:hypothetical protein
MSRLAVIKSNEDDSIAKRQKEKGNLFSIFYFRFVICYFLRPRAVLTADPMNKKAPNSK